MKKKVCFWLDSNISGLIPMFKGSIYACCNRAIPLIKQKKYSELTYEEIQQKRIELFNSINSKKDSPCKNCTFLVEKEEDEIDIGKISRLILFPHTTCNFNCQYCFFTQKDRKTKIDEDLCNIYDILKNFYNIGLLEDDFTLDLGGGEPLLLNNIDKTFKFMEEYYPKSTFFLVSNYSISSKVDNLIKILKNRKIKTVLKTSIDCGTKETYAVLRKKDAFKTVYKNLLKSAKTGIFDTIYLKYIIMGDGSNSDLKDLDDYIYLCKRIKKYNKNETRVILDANVMDQTDTKRIFSSRRKRSVIFTPKHLNDIEMKTAKYLYKNLIDFVSVKFNGDRLIPAYKEAREDIEEIKNSIK